MNKIYDYVIVGAGPSGLALAWYLSKENKSVLLIDSEKNIGGCHRVMRVDGLITEHGPRVYSDVYLNFIDLLKEMNLDFYDLFTLYSFDISNIGNKTKTSFKWFEVSSFIYSFIRLLINNEYGKDISMMEFMDSNSFTDDSRDYLERLCRLTDGAETSRYTLFQFLQLINNQILYKLYQPTKPTDRGFLYLIEQKLRETNLVTLMLNHEVININSNNNLVESITVNNKTLNEKNKYTGLNFILAIPPKPLYKLLLNSPSSENSFGPIDTISKWSETSSYFDYIPITLHWKDDIKLEKIWGFPASDWGLAFIILSNYMTFDDPGEFKTVISICITFTDRKSSVTNKTADESDINEIYIEVLRQIRESYPDLPNPDRIIPSPQVYYDNQRKKWINIDTAFVTTIDSNNNLPFKSEQYSNLYNCGAQNGTSNYHFTSLETAVVNALNLFNILEQNQINKRPVKDYNKITNYVHNMIGIIIFIILLYYHKKIYSIIWNKNY
jgi:protoporphyrinogen oxidase